MRVPVKKDRGRLIAAALQKIPCDLTIENVQYVNMFTGEIYPASVDILDGIVVRVREAGEATSLPSAQVYHGKGNYLLPGFIDTHMHVESTMMIPENLSRAIVPWGTTTVCTDPHEIGNVMGVDGVSFMLENGRKSTLRHYVLAPSCVPAVPALECAGAEFDAAQVGAVLDMPDVVGIAEIMDYVGVLKDTHRMHSIIEEGLKRDMYLQGHAPLVRGKELAAYRLGGPFSDHESITPEETCEKLRMGIHVNLRASSLADHLPMLVEGFKNHGWRDYVSICTDDVHAKDLITHGHINAVVKKVIAEGIPAVEAYKFATINAAREYGFDDLGAVAPNYIADIQLVKELDGSQPQAVFIAGRLVAEHGQYMGEDCWKNDVVTPNTVKMPYITSHKDFMLKAPEGCGDTVLVHCIVPDAEHSIIRNSEWVKLPVVDGYVTLDGVEGDLQFVCVVNRHGKEQKSIAILKGFGLKSGAFASTVSHDSHNFTVVYKNPQAAYNAAQELVGVGGGITVAKEDGVVHTLPLPVAGIMSTLPFREISADIEAMQQIVYQYCTPETSVLATAIMSLPVLPGTIITDKGIINGSDQTFLDVFKTDN